MANEILRLRTAVMRGGEKRHDLLFFFLVDPVIAVKGSTVVVTPSAGLPEFAPGQSAYGLLADGMGAALDAGSLVFEAASVVQPAGQSNADALTRLYVRYRARSQNAVRDLRTRYANTGGFLTVPQE